VASRTLADTFLALVAALAESVNANHAANFVRDFLIVTLAEKDLTEIWNPAQPVEVLNVTLWKQDRSPVEPRLIGHAGQNTILRAYRIGMYSDKQFLGSGKPIKIKNLVIISFNSMYSNMFFIYFLRIWFDGSGS